MSDNSTDARPAKTAGTREPMTADEWQALSAALARAGYELRRDDISWYVLGAAQRIAHRHHLNAIAAA